MGAFVSFNFPLYFVDVGGPLSYNSIFSVFVCRVVSAWENDSKIALTYQHKEPQKTCSSLKVCTRFATNPICT